MMIDQIDQPTPAYEILTSLIQLRKALQDRLIYKEEEGNLSRKKHLQRYWINPSEALVNYMDGKKKTTRKTAPRQKRRSQLSPKLSYKV